MPVLGAGDPLPARPRRVLVAGTSGAGKTTLATRIGEVLGLPRVELDSLHHGPGWQPLPTFEAEVRRLAAQPAWVTKWQYTQVRPLLAARADLLVWLDLSRARVLRQMVWRTARRRLRRQLLWNGNVEPPLWTVLTDREHIVRWAWSSHPTTNPKVAALVEQRPELPVVRLRTKTAVRHWVHGPLSDAGRSPRPPRSP